MKSNPYIDFEPIELIKFKITESDVICKSINERLYQLRDLINELLRTKKTLEDKLTITSGIWNKFNIIIDINIIDIKIDKCSDERRKLYNKLRVNIYG